MKKILPSLDEHLLTTIFKIAILITTAIALIVAYKLRWASGHPPGIAFIHTVPVSWLVIMLVIAITYYSLKFIVKKYDSFGDTDLQYTYSITVSCLYFLYLLLDGTYMMTAKYFIYYLGTKMYLPDISLIKIIIIIMAYLLLALTALKKRWARMLTILFLILPLPLFVHDLYLTVSNTYKVLEIRHTKYIIISTLSIWIIYDYLYNEKVKLYFTK